MLKYATEKKNKIKTEIYHTVGTVLLSKKTESTQEFHNLI